MAQKQLMTEGLVRCHYYWSANYKVQYASFKEVKPQETLRLGKIVVLTEWISREASEKQNHKKKAEKKETV